MAPQTSRRMAPSRTIKRLSSEKSTTARIIYIPYRTCGYQPRLSLRRPNAAGTRMSKSSALLLRRILENESIRNNAIARCHSGDDYLHVGRQHLSAGDFHSPESVLPCRHVGPFAVVQMENRGGRNRRIMLFLVGLESGGGEHAHPHGAGIGDLKPDLRSADRGIE